VSLELFFHPLSSFCQKALVALYENDTPFEPKFVDLMGTAQRAAFVEMWPIGKFPVLRDGDRLVPESSVIIEYLTIRSLRRRCANGTASSTSTSSCHCRRS
jgi:glutathione S-transferase